MATNAPARCGNCGVPITDPTTQVVTSSDTYCCPNCSAAVQQSGSGSDPHALDQGGRLTCAHCGTVIVDEATMESRGDDAFCCANCRNAMDAHGSGS